MAIAVRRPTADVTMDGVGGDSSSRRRTATSKVRGGSGFLFVALKRCRARSLLESEGGVRSARRQRSIPSPPSRPILLLRRLDQRQHRARPHRSGNESISKTVNGQHLLRRRSGEGLYPPDHAQRPEIANADPRQEQRDADRAHLQRQLPLLTFQLAATTRSARTSAFINVTIGSGSAHLELESFGGTIALRRARATLGRRDLAQRRSDRDTRGEGEGERQSRGVSCGPGGSCRYPCGCRARMARRTGESIIAAVAEAMAEAQPDRSTPRVAEAMAAAQRRGCRFVRPMPSPPYAPFRPRAASAAAAPQAAPRPFFPLLPDPAMHPAPPRPSRSSTNRAATRGCGRTSPGLIQHEPAPNRSGRSICARGVT